MKALKNKNLNEILWWDIETVRCVDKLEENTPLYESFEYKMRNSAEYDKFGGEEKSTQELFEAKAALFAEFSKICCISVGYVPAEDNRGREFKLKSYYGTDEHTLLSEFTKDILTFERKFKNLNWCGHSITGYDLPFVTKRLIVNQVEIPNALDQSMSKPWEANVIDIEMLWRGGAFSRASLINMAVALGLPSPKSSMNGSEVSDYYYQGKLKEIAEYCERDVETSFEIYKKLAYIK